MNQRADAPSPRFAGGFVPAEAPLAGTNLIEAGAGTGKTYAIAALYVRLVVEAAIEVGDILVVTYTVAATEELRDRIRRRVGDALQAFRTGSAPDPFLAALLRKCPGPGERRRAAERLTNAMRDFDEAAIHTIHGFCRRVLQENAFGSGSLFDTELIADDRELKREIVEDFWRMNFYECLPEVMYGALEMKYSPDALLKFVSDHPPHPDVRIIPEVPPPDKESLRGLISDLKNLRECLAKEWLSAREDVCVLLQGKALKANIYGARVPGLTMEMDRYLAAQGPFRAPFDGFVKFTPGSVEAALKKGEEPPRHPFLDTCGRFQELVGRLREALDRRFLFVKTELLRTMDSELRKRKQVRNVLYYDDLLLSLRRALTKPGGERLSEAIRRKYKAALIDEFQDTDPVQYAIFSAAFRREGSILFLIGDPKQAIYSFRGADIFAYLRAASHVDAVYTLDANWRSSPGLVTAVNTLFAHRRNPFVFPEIVFREAGAGDVPSRAEFTLDGRSETPFQWWFVPAEGYAENGKPLTKGVARERIAAAVAGEIAKLIRLGREGRARLGERPLNEGDVAILVRTNREARLFREMLTERGVPAVLHSSGNLFDSREAMEMERLFVALVSPDREDLLRGALSTDLLGCDLGTLGALEGDERGWEQWRERFRAYHDLWQKFGFLRMFRSLTEGEAIRTRLLLYPDGERRLTNLLHLAELLHGQESESQPGTGGLLKWLAEARDPATPRREEHQLRLESDAGAVRIVTIHKSKGLEYPVVFCPFIWSDPPDGGDAVSYHDPEDHMQVLDLGSEALPLHAGLALREKIAERVRLLYVALTRAKNRCTFVWGRINGTATSAPAYLFHGEASGEGTPMENGGESGACVLPRTDAEMFRDLKAIAEKSGGAIALLQMPDAAAEVPLQRREGAASLACREFAGAVDNSWRVASFSLLATGHSRSEALPDRDEGPDAPLAPSEKVPEMEEESIFAFPKGGSAGTLLHDILEHVDFGRTDDSALEGEIASKLREHGFETKWVRTLCDLVRRVVSHPLEGAWGPPDAIPPPLFCLSDIGPGERLNELEFHFPLKTVTREKLIGLFRGASPAGRPERGRVAGNGRREGGSGPEAFSMAMGRLRFDPVRGFMKGFVDMVFQHQGRFYLVDWKSNYLGQEKEDYHRDRLGTVMAEREYILQYHLYTMALHRYLQLRQPGYDYEAHFGGVYYLFLRGMEPAWGGDYGVFHDRPDRKLVELLCRELIGPGEEAW